MAPGTGTGILPTSNFFTEITMSTFVHNSEPQPEDFLTEEQVSRILNITPRTLVDWLRLKKIPYYKLGWKSVRIRRSDLEAFVNRALVPAREIPVQSPI